ncbi:hypothetical protein Hypma_013700 [Hypsizygus marmoreus]|uniref:Uncharacterized protein n=1 Tax=Hypsizygus marmoreus TaxID=39966 RepID=A0A369JKD8_HYPMA|nr:hypothetical protein Hypma_013700 [Hypsizygus marmoreus]
MAVVINFTTDLVYSQDCLNSSAQLDSTQSRMYKRKDAHPARSRQSLCREQNTRTVVAHMKDHNQAIDVDDQHFVVL